jgi:uncharacterized protein YneF (UPF0154 family)
MLKRLYPRTIRDRFMLLITLLFGALLISGIYITDRQKKIVAMKNPSLY